MKRLEPKLRAVGWLGFTDNKPFFEEIRDGYSDGLVRRAELFKSYQAARLRFEDVRIVLIDSRPKRSKPGRKP